MSTWINGRRQRAVDCRDRGLQYGDGLFETMRVRGRRVRLLDFHLERLLEGCRRLGIRAPSRAALRREIAARAALHADAVLKLIVTRGPGERGYRPTGRERATRVLSLDRLPGAAPAASAPVAPVRVRMCETPIGSNPALAGLKTLNRLESVMARSEWRDAGVWEGLMRDLDGHVICGTMSNLFLRRGSTLMTPALDRCGVAGVMRRWVLAEARNLRLRAWQGRLTWDTIGEAEEVFMTNAVAGIVSVALLEHGKSRIRLEQTETADRLRTRLELL
jgi:4-amino-4-deoxychorismate lyase